MLECIFTLDYEIYGDGHGSLRELVYEPAKRLKEVFEDAGAKLVVFVEVAELEKIDELLDIVHRQFTKVTFVLTIDVRCIIVTDTKARLCGVKVFVQH